MARKASASFWAGPRLAPLPVSFDDLGASAGPAAPAAIATPADRQATRTPRCRIEGRMARTYINSPARGLPYSPHPREARVCGDLKKQQSLAAPAARNDWTAGRSAW